MIGWQHGVFHVILPVSLYFKRSSCSIHARIPVYGLVVSVGVAVGVAVAVAVCVAVAVAVCVAVEVGGTAVVGGAFVKVAVGGCAL